MKTAPVAPFHWSRQRWCMTIALALAGHVGLVLLLAERAPATPRQASNTLRLLQVPERLVGRWLAELPVSDPSGFALSNPNGFSGAAWLKNLPLDHPLYEWHEAPLWLNPKAGQLSEGFLQFMRTNRPAPLEVADKPAPEVIALELPAPGTAVTQTVLRVEGELANRPMILVPALPLQTNGEVLAGTTVQVVVNAAGYPLTATVLAPGSGSKEADERALRLAREIQFQPLRRDGPERSLNAGKPTLGQLIFDWYTVPAATNGAPATANP